MANFSLSTPQQQSNLENTKRNVLTNRCKNISFMLNDYAPSTFDSALSQSLTQREHLLHICLRIRRQCTRHHLQIIWGNFEIRSKG